jgi:hypothetical protein
MEREGRMIYIEAPSEAKEDSDFPSVFLAGGITDCPDWQNAMVTMLEDIRRLVLFNPRKKNFPMDDPSAAKRQIAWEFYYLRKAQGVSFWFPMETICPIVLFELGAWSMTGKPIFVGVHPEYERRVDIEIQMSLVRPMMKIQYSLKDLAAEVRKWAR